MKRGLLFLWLIVLIFASPTVWAEVATEAKPSFLLKHPVILVHGASMGGAYLRVGPLRLGDYFQRIPTYLRQLGVKEIAVPHLTTNASIGEQAVILKNFLNEKYPFRKVNIVAHSMGGLAARFLVSVLKYPHVASITFIATPNHGSPLADWAYDQVESKGFWYWVLRLFGYDMKQRRFLPELRMQYMKEKFNPRVPDRRGVKYFSVQAYATIGNWTMSPVLYFPHWFLGTQDHPYAQVPNDGLVPLASQKWGESLGEFELDHLAQINHHTLRPSMEEQSLAMYRKIIETLARRGL